MPQQRKLIGVMSVAGPKGEKGDSGAVTSWNTRTGDVVPEYGDYNLHMVGAELISNTDLDKIWENN